MDPLKHAILPIYSVLHIAVMYLMIFSGDKKNAIDLFDWPDKDDEGNVLTMWEHHALGIVTGAHIAFLFGCIVGIVFETAQFRSILAAMEAIFWSYGAYDALVLGFPCVFAYIMFGLAVLGIANHLREEGFFTKNASSAKNAKNKSE